MSACARRSSSVPLFAVGPQSADGPVQEAARESSLLLLQPRRTVGDDVLSPVQPAIWPGWDVVGPDFAWSRWLRHPVPNDYSSLARSTNRVVLAAGQFGIETTLISDPLPRGVNFGGARIWWQMFHGSVVGTTIQPASIIRVFDAAGLTQKAILLPFGLNGSGAAASGSNQPTMVTFNASLAPYVTDEGDRLVGEVGFFSSATAESNSAYGTWTRDPALGDAGALPRGYQTQGFENTGNPGVRLRYAEIVLAKWL